VEAKANEVAQKLEAMDGDPAIAEAERAIEALEGALGQADELAVKDKKQLAFFAGEKKKIGGYRAKIEKQRFGKQVAAHARSWRPPTKRCRPRSRPSKARPNTACIKRRKIRSPT
jgi:hypothetical protein